MHDPRSRKHACLACRWWTDIQRGFKTLAAQAEQALKKDQLAGHLFVFRGRRGDLIKIIWWDGQSVFLFSKRLEKGRFV